MVSIARPPAISVVVPCFNATTTLSAALRSASAQTLCDIEIIVVDDGSTDGSAALARAFSVRDPRIRLIEKANGGASAARNSGVLSAKSRLIAFLDADDTWTPDYLDTHAGLLQREPNVGVSFSAVTFVGADGRATAQSQPKLRHINPRDVLVYNPAKTCSSLVVRRDVFREVGLFNVGMQHSEDQEWLFRVTLSGWLIKGDATPRVMLHANPKGLGADIEGAQQGFELLIGEARKRAPTLVAREEARARGIMLRVLSRRAMRLGLPAGVARRLMVRAIAIAPSLVFREPIATLSTLGATLMPRAALRPFLKTTFFAPIEA